jgi:hypothetical protein
MTWSSEKHVVWEDWYAVFARMDWEHYVRKAFVSLKRMMNRVSSVFGECPLSWRSSWPSIFQPLKAEHHYGEYSLACESEEWLVRQSVGGEVLRWCSELSLLEAESHEQSSNHEG